MSAALDYAAPYGTLPHRKPLPGSAYPSGVTGNDNIYTRQPSHSHSRTASSNVIPPQQYAPQPAYQPYNPSVAMQPGTRRSLSNATSSTASSGNAANTPMNRAPTQGSYNSSIQRSVSSRSQQQPSTSYAALLRRQKATVWCDHAQHEDPRVLAQQRQAKARANMHLAGGATNRASIASSGGVRSKIRHHGAVKASAYTAGNLAGAGVPMRLSASEVDDADSDDDLRRRYHVRNESTRSSLSSSGPRASTAQPRLSASSTPDSRNSSDAAKEEAPSADYFARQSVGGGGPPLSAGSEEERFGEMGKLPVRVASTAARQHTADELRRRGSVDERTSTMTGVRLFVANPDLSD